MVSMPMMLPYLKIFCFKFRCGDLLGADGSECQVDGMPTPVAKAMMG